MVTNYPGFFFFTKSSRFFKSRFGCPGSRIKSSKPNKTPNVDFLNEAVEKPGLGRLAAFVYTTITEGAHRHCPDSTPASKCHV